MDSHLYHRRIGVHMKHTVNDGTNLLNDDYELGLN